MPRLTLRVDVVDNTNPKKPNRPVAFSVQGFTCGTAAYLSESTVNGTTWVLHRCMPGESFEQMGHFHDPAEAIEYLEAWVRTMEEKYGTHAPNEQIREREAS